MKEELIILDKLEEARNMLRGLKEKEGRSEKARKYAITLTELEQLIGYFDCFVIRQHE